MLLCGVAAFVWLVEHWEKNLGCVVQAQVLQACANGAASTKGSKPGGVTLLVANESPHIMVDDVGAVMVDRCVPLAALTPFLVE